MDETKKAFFLQNPPTVAEYLAQQIELSRKSHIQIAKEVGFPHPNIISMLKRGTIKLPIARVGPIAKALGIDALDLYMRAMSEYEPGNWMALKEAVFRQPRLTEKEIEIIEIIRMAEANNINFSSVRIREKLFGFIKTLSVESDF
jgi:hypothetical protein